MSELTIPDRVLFFPVTAFDAAVLRPAGRVPVVAGAGGPLGHALDCARATQKLGADGLLVLPPHLVGAPQAGLVAYVERVAAASDLPVIVYHRGNARFTPASVAGLLQNPRVAGLKDGAGDVAVAQQFVLEAGRSGRDVLLFNGLLTAELSQAAYTAIGVPLYSSAAFAMLPEMAVAFFAAHRAGDVVRQRALLDGFSSPLIALRDETPGFAVSLVKAGVRLQGMPVGPVHAPLTDPSPEQVQRLARIVERGRELVA
ncbi:5-dehydro-4-deoxyglucarate dehydratase [Microbacterium betulae]|uniref:5-dehydro-4-deoxyglucarate dehydratase n=1 Tax=Microbacterium betulae TaxID=2981139 RepID=A0AA97FL13_9MICO|nr:5-dehydro-4-deoxyglucarate dehydratase [Microbacterium sp. AB]WOF24245.1 5-dehydro-4-deoxyglucarate dehydratase [Microbacterium sp. AB]